MVSLFDLPVFHGPDDELITGHKRATLKGYEARRRWDYFFRATPGAIEQYFSEEKEKWRSQLMAGWDKRTKAIVGLVILVLFPLAVAGAVWQMGKVADLLVWVRGLMREMDVSAQIGDEGLIAILLVPFALMGLIGFVKYLPRLADAASAIREAKRGIRNLKKVIRDLIRQIPHNTPTDQEMLEFVQRRLTDLEQRARQYLRLDQDNITVEVSIPPIQEWAYMQPQDKPGYQSIERENPEFLKAMRATNADAPNVYAVYYIQYLFPTKDYIAVHSEFFDAISDETRGKSTDEYYYADVTSIRTEVSELERKVYFSPRIPELVKLRLTVASGDAVEVRMFDERVQRTLNEYLEDRRKVNIEALRRLHASMENASREEKAAIEKELDEAASARQRVVQDDRASFAEGVVRDIRHQLRLKKGTEPQQKT